MKKLARIEAWDAHGPMMTLYAMLSAAELGKVEKALQKMSAENLIRGYKAEPLMEMKQLHIQFLSFAALKTELDDLRRLMKRNHELSGPKDWSPVSHDAQAIADAIAKGFFVTAWADAMEERGITFPGQELYDIAPETAPVAKLAARAFIKKMEESNDMPIGVMYGIALKKAGVEDSPKMMEEFGFMTAMQALGSGLRWEDNFPDHGFDVPYHDFGEWALFDRDLHLEDYK